MIKPYLKHMNLIMCAKHWLIALSLIFTFNACNKTLLEQALVTPESTENDTVYTSEYARNLNIVYFVPNDVDTIAGYHKRLSELLIWTRDYFKREMTRNGYPDKTFGLLTNDSLKLVKIVTIYGTKDKTKYRYDGGGDHILSEMNAYFAANPQEKTSSHTLIITPQFGNVGNPFYGSGRNCFAMDYPGMDIQNMGNDANFTKLFGGMVHELGHGLNLPHNSEKVSEKEPLGTALMGSGNRTLGKDSTFLTAADAAVLNVNQIFNKDSKTYYGAVTASISKIYAAYSATKQAFVVSGRFTSNTPIKSILYFNDPNVKNEGTGVNKDYNAIAWETKTIGVDSFYVEMPLSDFVYKADDRRYELKVKLVAENGTVKETIYNYHFNNDVPVINLGAKVPLSKTGWIATASSEDPARPVSRLIDNNESQGWKSNVTGAHPDTITIDLGKQVTADGYSILNSYTYAVKNVEMLYSIDGINYTSLGTKVIPKASGMQHIDFISALTFRYFKLIAKSSHNGSAISEIVEFGFYSY